MSERTEPHAADPGLDEILDARRRPGPVQRKGAGPVAWFDPRKGRLGHLAFSMNRITGLALVGYLYLHLAVLSQLLIGPSAWHGFLARATTPIFLGLDVILIGALLIHGLNGLRIALTSLGIAVPAQKGLFIGLMAGAVIGIIVFGIKMFGGA